MVSPLFLSKLVIARNEAISSLANQASQIFVLAIAK
jgi:hypothetical protein